MAVILVDSSIWIDHIRSPNSGLAAELADGNVLQHPFVTAEVALGSMRNRALIVSMLGELPQAPVVVASGLINFIDEAGLPGTGIGMVDAHLLASAAELDRARVWTRDKRLARQAERLGLIYEAS